MVIGHRQQKHLSKHWSAYQPQKADGGSDHGLSGHCGCSKLLETHAATGLCDGGIQSVVKISRHYHWGQATVVAPSSETIGSRRQQLTWTHHATAARFAGCAPTSHEGQCPSLHRVAPAWTPQRSCFLHHNHNAHEKVFHTGQCCAENAPALSLHDCSNYSVGRQPSGWNHLCHHEQPYPTWSASCMSRYAIKHLDT